MWFACHTDITPMQEETLRCNRPLRFRNESLQILFDALGIIGGGHAQPIGHSFDMGIDDNSRFSKGVSQNDIGGFPPHARQGRQAFHRRRNLSVESFCDRSTAGDKMLGLTLKKSG